jgi:hypothetical protein
MAFCPLRWRRYSFMNWEARTMPYARSYFNAALYRSFGPAIGPSGRSIPDLVFFSLPVYLILNGNGRSYRGVERRRSDLRI